MAVPKMLAKRMTRLVFGVTLIVPEEPPFPDASTSTPVTVSPFLTNRVTVVFICSQKFFRTAADTVSRHSSNPFAEEKDIFAV